MEVWKLQSIRSVREQSECDKGIEFVTNSYSQSSVPLLVVFTNDQSLKAVNYASVERAYLKEQMNEHAVDVVSSHSRRKRQTTTCGVYPLTIPTATITEEITGRNSFTIISPLSYNAGICGGRCLYQTPVTTIRHTLMVNLYFRLNPIPSGYSISQCCAPAYFSPLVVHGHEPGASLVKLILPHMSVNTCECLEVVKYP